MINLKEITLFFKDFKNKSCFEVNCQEGYREF
uniref:Uncharacterized protein n=1 Tax=Rhizophora mucronata TaxID=61149 RepID=A0A2P2NGP2_RHIMU